MLPPRCCITGLDSWTPQETCAGKCAVSSNTPTPNRMFVSVWDFLAASFGKIHADGEVARAGTNRPHAVGPCCAISFCGRRSPGASVFEIRGVSRHKSMDVPGSWQIDSANQSNRTDGGQTHRPHPEERRRRNTALVAVVRDARIGASKTGARKWAGESPIGGPQHCGWSAFPATADDIRAGTAQ
jgi:hypothetical protein